MQLLEVEEIQLINEFIVADSKWISRDRPWLVEFFVVVEKYNENISVNE